MQGSAGRAWRCWAHFSPAAPQGTGVQLFSFARTHPRGLLQSALPGEHRSLQEVAAREGHHHSRGFTPLIPSKASLRATAIHNIKPAQLDLHFAPARHFHHTGAFRRPGSPAPGWAARHGAACCQGIEANAGPLPSWQSYHSRGSVTTPSLGSATHPSAPQQNPFFTRCACGAPIFTRPTVPLCSTRLSRDGSSAPRTSRCI